MKLCNLLLTIGLAFTATTAFAALTSYTGPEGPSDAFDYEISSVPYTNQVYQGNDWEYFKITIKGGSGRIYLVDFMNSPDWNTSESLQQQISRYGYYDVKDKDIYYTPTENDIHVTNISEAQTIKLQTLERTDAQQTFYRYAYDLGKDFQEGDEVGIWLERYGQSAGSYTAVQNQNSTRYRTNPYSMDQWALQSGYVMPVAEFSVNGQVRLGLFFAANEMPVIGGDTGTAGSPLPGGLPTALVGGLFALGFWYIRRRKAISA